MRLQNQEKYTKKLSLTSLGCAKNLIDSEVMLGRLVDKGWVITQDPADADTIVINTCSFIESAMNESIDTILELAKYKQIGSCRRLKITGCLPQRFMERIYIRSSVLIDYLEVLLIYQILYG